MRTPEARAISRGFSMSIFTIGLAAAILTTTCGSGERVAAAQDKNVPTEWTLDSAAYTGGSLKILSGFTKPYGLEVQPDGELFVVDLDEGRVIRFRPDLAFNGWLGMSDGGSASGWHTSGLPEAGSAHGQLKWPHSIAFDQSSNIFVADYGNGRVHRYDASGSFEGLLFDPPPTAELGFAGPPNAVFDAGYNLWIADFDAHRIFKFAPDLSLAGWLGQRASGEITTGFVTDGYSQKTAALGGFNKPHMVRVDQAGNFLVVETGNHRIQKFSADGTFVGWIGAYADGSLTDGWASDGLSAASGLPGGFRSPVSLRLMAGDSMLIADNGNHRLQKFSSEGHFAGWLGGRAGGGVTTGWESSGLSAEGTDAGSFSYPFDAQLAGNLLYVADGHNGRVQIFQLD